MDSSEYLFSFFYSCCVFLLSILATLRMAIKSPVRAHMVAASCLFAVAMALESELKSGDVEDEVDDK